MKGCCRTYCAESDGGVCMVPDNCGLPPPRPMTLGDLYAYRQYGWHQFNWPILPVEWYS